MKKSIKLIAIMLVIVCLAAAFASCGKASIVGTWTRDHDKWVFTDDGKCVQTYTLDQYSQTIEYTYEYEGDILTFTDAKGKEKTYVVKQVTSDKMVLVPPEGVGERTFKRAK